MSHDVHQVGVDHQLAPIGIREQIALDSASAEAVASRIASEVWAEEVALLSTCNRTELYVTSAEATGGELALDALLRSLPRAPAPDSGCYRLQSGPAAAQHLLRVTCGLESAIVGETEIQGQVRETHERGRNTGTIGPLLDRLFQTAIRTGKRARSETPISSGGVSHGSAAAQVVQRIFENLDDRQVMIVGAGIIAGQAARALADLGPDRMVVVNRTQANADALAETLPRSETRGLDALAETLAGSHVGVFATGAEPLPADVVAAAVHRRRDPLLLVDLGVPRCIHPDAAGLPGVFLYDLESLERIVAGALSARLEAVPAVEALIGGALEDYLTWARGRGAAPAIQSLNAWAESVRQAELRWLPEDLPGETRDAVDQLTRRLVQRLLGRAAARVVKGAGSEDPDLPTPQDLRSVFGLEEGES